MKPDSPDSGRRAAASLLLAAGLLPAAVFADFPLRVQTDLGALDLLMLDSVAPITVANFMNYVGRNDYDNTFIHRSAPGFVVQGGGYIMTGAPGTFFSGGTQHIPEDPPIVNEFNLSNVRGTVAMAKLSTGPDTATSEWFVNLADNSGSPNFLDTTNGGYTVFAQVQGNGMSIFDTITTLPTCLSVVPIALFCQPPYAKELPLADSSGVFDNTTLINIQIGLDNDRDGAIDKFEDAGPNFGDANNDSIPDSTQQNVASYLDAAGENVAVVSPLSQPLSEFSTVGVTYGLAYPPAPSSTLEALVANGMRFNEGYVSFDVPATGPGGIATVTMTLPAGASPNTFYVYGPEPGNASSHWYEFLYDGTTGAQFNGNIVTLHFVDGLRGDADLDNSNGVIRCAHGGPASKPGDSDGVPDAVEDAGPNNGDGNNDGIPDSQQDNVVTLPDTIRGTYITLADASPLHTLKSVKFLNQRQLPSPPTVVPEWLNGLNLTHEFLSFDITGVTPGGTADVELILPANEQPVKYVKYGPDPTDATDHFYEFDYDAASGTGAQISDNVVTLHFVDGGRGDFDLAQNGVISDPGAPALTAAITTTSGGGCSVLTVSGSPWRGGAWLLIALCAIPLAVRRYLR
jgi:cyclophilin family peptidyl-prolyl cis-trans isomerase